MGIRLIIYLDDILILHQAKDQLELLVPQVCQLFEALGLLINKKKSLLIPAQCLEFLGFQICSCTLVISVPKEKLCKISQDAYRPATPDDSVSERVSKVCREGCSHSARNISSSTGSTAAYVKWLVTGKDSVVNSVVEYSVMVPRCSGNAGG